MEFVRKVLIDGETLDRVLRIKPKDSELIHDFLVGELPTFGVDNYGVVSVVQSKDGSFDNFGGPTNKGSRFIGEFASQELSECGNEGAFKVEGVSGGCEESTGNLSEREHVDVVSNSIKHVVVTHQVCFSGEFDPRGLGLGVPFIDCIGFMFGNGPKLVVVPTFLIHCGAIIVF